MQGRATFFPKRTYEILESVAESQIFFSICHTPEHLEEKYDAIASRIDLLTQ